MGSRAAERQAEAWRREIRAAEEIGNFRMAHDAQVDLIRGLQQ